MPCIAVSRAEAGFELLAGGIGAGQGGDAAAVVVVVVVVAVAHHIAAARIAQDAATTERFRDNREVFTHGRYRGAVLPL